MIANNDAFTVIVPEKGVIDGHVAFRLHETDPDNLVAAGMCANLISSLLFEKLHAQGTNIVLSLFGDHGTLDIVARNENDGLNLLWQPTQTTPDRLNEAQERLTDKILTEQHQEQPEEEPEKQEDDEFIDDDEEMMKQLLRIP